MADPTFDLTAFVRGREKALEQNDQDLFTQQKLRQNEMSLDVLGEQLDTLRRTKDDTISTTLASNAARRAGAEGTLEDYKAQRAVDAALSAQPENLTDALSHTSPLARALAVRPQVAASGPRGWTYYQSTIVPRALSEAIVRAQNDPQAMNDVLLSPLAGGGRYQLAPGQPMENGAATVVLQSKAPDGRMMDVVRGTPQDIARMVASQLGVTKLFSGMDAYQRNQRLALTDARNLAADTRLADTAAANAEMTLSRAGAYDAQAEARLRARDVADAQAAKTRSADLANLARIASAFKDNTEFQAKVMAVLDRYMGATP